MTDEQHLEALDALVTGIDAWMVEAGYKQRVEMLLRRTFAEYYDSAESEVSREEALLRYTTDASVTREAMEAHAPGRLDEAGLTDETLLFWATRCYG